MINKLFSSLIGGILIATAVTLGMKTRHDEFFKNFGKESE